MRKAIALLLVLLLAACGGEEFGDLKAELKDKTKDLRGRIDPLPETAEFFRGFADQREGPADDQAGPGGRNHPRSGSFPPARGAGAGECDDRALPRDLTLNR